MSNNIVTINNDEFVKLELLKKKDGLLKKSRISYDIQGYCLNRTMTLKVTSKE